MTQGPMGQAHGANAGKADSPAEQWAMRANQIELGLNLANLKKQGEVLDSQAEQNKALALKTTEEAQTERELREGKLKEIFYRGRNQYIDNVRKMFEDMATEDSDKWSIEAYDDFYGDHRIDSTRLPTKKDSAEIIKTLSESEAAKGQYENSKALAELNTERKKYLFIEAMSNLIQAEAAKNSGLAAIENAATNRAQQAWRELSTQYEYGIEKTPKFWVDLGERILKAIGIAVGAAAGARGLAK